MKNSNELNAVDRIEIVTLQDNYIDLTAGDNSEIVSRAREFMRGGRGTSIQAEHGFSALIRTTKGDETKTLLFDFGFSEDGAARNAVILNVAMGQVEAMVLSHGHFDHFGGLENLVRMIDRKGIPLILHPAAFRPSRYTKSGDGLREDLPELTRERVERAGVTLVETKDPLCLPGGHVLFLGEIARKTSFEKGMPNAYYSDDGMETWDPMEDDSSIVMNLRGKGLVVLSGCAHSGIVNTVNHAVATTGIGRVHVVMGGFHLGGPLFEPLIDPTTAALKNIDPAYVIPCHCTGRKASVNIEREMPGQFILNMSGTKLTFSA